MPKFIDKIYLVDDKCPENSVKKVKSKSKKIKKIFRKINGGVGAAVKDGYNLSLKDKNYLTVRIDGDGQMDLNLIKRFIDPIINNEAEFTKGNRFSNFSFIRKMPALRILGNIFFSLFGNLIIKNLSIFDFLNGYTSLSNRAIYKVMKTNLDNDFFFDSTLIYQSAKLKIKILDIDMEAKYENEKSNIKIVETGLSFLVKNILFILGFKK